MVVTLLPYTDYVANELYSKLETAVYKDLLAAELQLKDFYTY